MIRNLWIVAAAMIVTWWAASLQAFDAGAFSWCAAAGPLVVAQDADDPPGEDNPPDDEDPGVDDPDEGDDPPQDDPPKDDPPKKDKKKPTGVIKGTVQKNGRVLKQSQIRIQIVGLGEKFRMKAKSDGTFEFTEVPAGKYTLKATGSFKNVQVSGELKEVEPASKDDVEPVDLVVE